ncbi:DNA alkylation repair protein [Curvibacter sp. APW13]|uniref:DNA alkylation repair protein n=1 Tax=Curvibacter sp. APW13 TaxID=3077236 RepID=UPI0028E03D02|nr:DNA alkylation repair protein [Curvibacter sp. APW13]MDT8990986.1 DNA alkylation repair protein [Curvibacter sp. APW13]
MTHTAPQALHALSAQRDPAKAAFFQRFFKCGPGQYGEGDQFLGLPVPQVRSVLPAFRNLPVVECVALLQSPYNEARLLALLVLVAQYQRKRAPDAERQAVFDAYLAHRDRVNNWNLVDASAPAIVGGHLLPRDRTLLYTLAQSPVLWDRRIAVLASFAFIRAGEHADTLRLCEQLLGDREDLMHKACGWMLREVGKRDPAALRGFLDAHAHHMPRTMLRYALEKLAPEVRAAYMAR